MLQAPRHPSLRGGSKIQLHEYVRGRVRQDLVLSVGAADDRDYRLLTDLVINDSSDIYVADPGRRRVVCVSKRWGGGRTIATFSSDGTIVWPGHLAPKGKLFVSDPRTDRIAAIDLEIDAHRRHRRPWARS